MSVCTGTRVPANTDAPPRISGLTSMTIEPAGIVRPCWPSYRNARAHRVGAARYCAAVRDLLAAYPVCGSPPQVHHCKDADDAGLGGVQQSIGKATQKAPSYVAVDGSPSLGILGDGPQAPIHLIQERDSEPRALKFVVLGGIVQLTVSKLVERDQPHLLQFRPCLAKHVCCCPSLAPLGIPVSVAARCLFRPQPSVLFLG